MNRSEAIIVAIVAILVFVGLAAGGCRRSNREKWPPPPQQQATRIYFKAELAYMQGANDALDALALLALEQQLQGTNRTWGEMARIVCDRMGVERRINGTL